MKAEPNAPILPLLRQILDVQRYYRDIVIAELPLPRKTRDVQNYILECERILFSPRLFREICIRLASLMTSHIPETDFISLIFNLEDSTLEELATTVQCCLEPDLVEAMEITVRELRLHKLCPLDPSVLAGFFLAAIVPFYTAYAHQQAPKEEEWQRGWCPVCGQYPVNGYNRPGDGRRILGCWMCETEWIHSRLTCPICSSSQEGQLMLFLEEDSNRRIQVCDNCGYYIKITDFTQAQTGVTSSLKTPLRFFWIFSPSVRVTARHPILND